MTLGDVATPQLVVSGQKVCRNQLFLVMICLQIGDSDGFGGSLLGEFKTLSVSVCRLCYVIGINGGRNRSGFTVLILPHVGLVLSPGWTESGFRNDGGGRMKVILIYARLLIFTANKSLVRFKYKSVYRDEEDVLYRKWRPLVRY